MKLPKDLPNQLNPILESEKNVDLFAIKIKPKNNKIYLCKNKYLDKYKFDNKDFLRTLNLLLPKEKGLNFHF